MKTDMVLSSSFHVNATLKGDIDAVKTMLSGWEHLKILGNGMPLRYEIQKKGNKQHNSVVELSGSRISLRFFFGRQSDDDCRENLLTLMSIIAHLKGLYEVKLEDIYEYVVDSLGRVHKHPEKDDSALVNGLKERIRILNESNCSLAYQLISSSKENVALSRSLSLHKKFSHAVMDRFIGEGKSVQLDYPNELKSIGIDQELAIRIESDLSAEGAFLGIKTERARKKA